MVENGEEWCGIVKKDVELYIMIGNGVECFGIVCNLT